ncbi:MAG: endonuclease/exonuclease/phosphatase family protein [Candidatus Cryptobacteroides sp.]
MTIVAVLTLLSMLSVVVNPAKIWMVTLLGLLFVPLAILNFILLIWAIKRRSKSFVIPLVALLPAFYFLGMFVRVPFREMTGKDVQEQVEVVSPNDDTIKFLTYNVGRFALYDKDKDIPDRSACLDSICSYILSENPDIVCLQEVYVPNGQSLRKAILKKLKGYTAEYYLFTDSKGSYGNLTLSRFPVKDKGKIKFEESSNLAIYTDYEAYGRKFRVYNCHFESYNISFTGIVRSLFPADGDGFNEEVFNEAGNKMIRSISRRPKQVNQVFSDIENCPVESFVCGDFNDNPMSYTYYRMTRGRRDAFVDAGRWFGATYSLLWPFLRIDYVLYPDRYRAVGCRTPRVGYSDHYPVVADVVLN